MMDRTPFDEMLDGLEWKPVEHEGTLGPESDPTLPIATHEGILEIGRASLRVYQLDDGRRVIESSDLERFFGGGEHAGTTSVCPVGAGPVE